MEVQGTYEPVTTVPRTVLIPMKGHLRGFSGGLEVQLLWIPKP